MSSKYASAALLLGGTLWGLYWIPVRWLGMQGLSGVWTCAFLFAGSLVLMVPAFWLDRRRIQKEWKILVFGGAFTGAAFGLYTVSLLYTDVVRSILLFYLTPLWGTGLGVLFLGERLALHRIVALTLGLVGLGVVLWGDQALPMPQNLGDTLALMSGIFWALGTFGLYKAGKTSMSLQIVAFLLVALLIVVLAAVFMGDHTISSTPNSRLIALFGYALLLAFFIIPMIWLTLWPASFLTPARVGLLLMSEVVVGLSSAALISDEVFGLREAFGAVLILTAALAELTGHSDKSYADQ